jgi:hypothetical protein
MSGAALAADAAIREADAPELPAVDDVPERPRRRVTLADGVGVLVVVSTMLVVNQAAVVALDTPLGASRGIRVVSLAIGVVTVAGLVVLLVRERGNVGRMVRSITDIWRDPPTDGAAFVLGAALALPLLGLYWPRLGEHADSGRLLSSVDHVWRGDLGYLVDVQEPYLPHILYGPAMAVGGLPAARFLAIGSLVLLAGVTALITYRATTSLWGAGAAVLALACIDGAARLALYAPMYPLMLTLGYLGGWYAYQALTDPESRWRYPVIAGVCIALAPEAHAVGQLFLAVPALVAVLAPTFRRAVTATARTYLVVVLATLPRLAINLAQGGIDWIATYRTDFWVTQGYVRFIQDNLWSYEGIGEPRGYYLSHLPGRYYAGLGGWGWIVVAGVALGWLCLRWRHRLFVLAALGFMVLAVTAEQIPGFPRYYSPLYPGMAVVTGVLVAVLARQRDLPRRLGAAVVVAGLGVGASVTFR